MSPRPRTISDEEILAATGRVMSRVGPARLTLQDIATEAGLAPATLVQRFGSKRNLLLALSRGATEYVDACFAAARAAHATPLQALLNAATEMARYTQKPEEMANHLAWLQLDLSDADFYDQILENARRSQRGYRELLDDAVAAGELKPCDTQRLAQAIGSLSGGSLLSWAILRQGTAEEWARRDLQTLLQPYSASGRVPARRTVKAAAKDDGRRKAGKRRTVVRKRQERRD
jgi:AcrR family transcriptional regulator